MFKFLTFILIATLAINSWGQSATRIGTDKVKIGKAGSTSPLKIEANDGSYLKKDIAGNWLFSNDGVLEKKLGSGSGSGGSSGVNILVNDSFEDGLTPGWTSSGGTFTQQTYTNSVDGDTKYARFVSTIAGEYFESGAVAIPSNFSSGCQVDFKKINISADNLFKIEAIDGSANILATANVKLSSWVKFPTLSFQCPASPTTVKVRVTSLAAGTIEVDKGYVGSNQNIVNTIVSNDYNRTLYTPIFTGFGTVTAHSCYHSRQGSELVIDCRFDTGTPTATEARVSLPNSLVPSSSMVANKPLGAWIHANPLIVPGPIHSASPNSYITFGSGAAGNNGFASLNGNAILGSANTLAFNARIPIEGWSEIRQQDIAINTDQASWLIDANIGGTNPSLGIGAVSSYNEIGATTIDLVINGNKGSANAEMPCASGTASSGLTCGGVNESLGIAFVPPNTGSYEVCFQFSHLLETATGGTITTAFQLVETSNTSTAIITEGGDRKSTGTGGGATMANTYPVKTCGNFNFTDVSKKTIRLQYEQAVTGTVSTNVILTDRNANVGQRDIHVTVKPVLSAYNRPYLTGDQVVTPGAVKPEIFTISYGAVGDMNAYCTGNPCGMDQIGTIGTSMGWSSAGVMNLILSKSFSKLKCGLLSTVGAGGVGAVAYNGFSCNNCSSVLITTINSTNHSYVNSRGNIFCEGQP